MQRAANIRDMRARKMPARPAFTLIELLVVIAIIAILVGITTVAVIPLLRKGPELRTVSEISQLKVALQEFKTRFGMYPPSYVLLSNVEADYNASPAAVLSRSYLNSMFGRLNFNNASSPIDWSGGYWNAGNPMPAGGVWLEGDQCLVFFLEGIPDVATGVGLGFSTDKTNPTKPGGTRIKFFNFQAHQIKRLRPNNPFPSCVDPYDPAPTLPPLFPTSPPPGQPYVYFSSERGGATWARPLQYGPHSSLIPNGPYYEMVSSGKRYHQDFQIISAGPNGKFGPGGQWTAINASAIGVDGLDDQANFYDAKLGVPSN